MTGQPLISARNLQQRFGKELALSHTSFEIQRGEFVSIVGPSGCGKSTILRMIAGLLSVSEGEITIDGKSPREIDRARERIALVFQEANLLPWRTAEKNIGLPLELRKMPAQDRNSRVQASIQRVGLTPNDADKLPRMLSGGMKMRVSLARALVTQPTIMLMDEPFSALDDVLRNQLNEDLLGLWAENNWTTLFVTHNMIEAVFLSQRVIVMSARPGKIVETVAVPFEYPRRFELQTTSEFTRIVAQVARALRSAAVSEATSLPQ